MRKVYFLSTCSTCQRIMSDLIMRDFESQDIKAQPITPEQLDEIRALSGSYEALFSRRAMKYKSWGLKDKILKEEDLRQFILSEYTFLKRPVILLDGQVFIGSSRIVMEALRAALR